MSKLIFVLGGARSGKSSYAVNLAKKLNKKTAFIATADANDSEMRSRIKKHKLSRPRKWKLIEESREIAKVLTGIKNKYEVILVDCLGLFVSNLLCDNLSDTQILKRLKKLPNAISGSDSTVILVSNEVGGGIVPDNPLARRFRDLVGSANQVFAKNANTVIVMHSGIPIVIKRKMK